METEPARQRRSTEMLVALRTAARRTSAIRWAYRAAGIAIFAGSQGAIAMTDDLGVVWLGFNGCIVAALVLVVGELEG